MAETSVAITAGTGTPIDAYNVGAGAALRQAIVVADPVTTADVARVTSDGGLQIAGTQAAVASTSWTSATALNTANTISVTGYNTVSVATVATSTFTGGVLTFEVSPDNSNWFPIAMCRIDSYTVETTYTLVATTNRAWSTSVDGFTNFRVRLSTAITGTGTLTSLVTPQTMPIEPIVSVGQATAANLAANVGLINGVAPLMGNGVTGTGSLRVTLASDTTTNTNPLLTNQQTAATGTITSVTAAATSTTILASNASRKGASVYNDSTSLLYLSTSATAASATVYSVQVPAGGYYELPNDRLYTGQLTGIWVAANGAARVTELT